MHNRNKEKHGGYLSNFGQTYELALEKIESIPRLLTEKLEETQFQASEERELMRAYIKELMGAIEGRQSGYLKDAEKRRFKVLDMYRGMKDESITASRKAACGLCVWIPAAACHRKDWKRSEVSPQEYRKV